MNRDRFSLDSYFNRELRFWKSMKAVYVNKGRTSTTLKDIRGRFTDKEVGRLADARFKSMATLVRLFKPKYRDQITKRVNKELGADLKDALDLTDILRWRKQVAPPGASLAYDWIPVAVAIVIIIIVIIAESNDNNGVQEDDTVIVTVGTGALSELVEKSTFLTCQEIEALNYNTWATYLNIARDMDSTGTEYLKALICASCPNLRVYVESYQYNFELLLPDSITWLGAFFFVAKLDECGIPY
jgi:hypothetical protein